MDTPQNAAFSGRALPADPLGPVLDGWWAGAERKPSPNNKPRPQGLRPWLVVAHNISLPPFRYGLGGPLKLFCNEIGEDESDPFLRSVRDMRVAPHFFVQRDGKVWQTTSCELMAFHAGASDFEGHGPCNPYSIGVEIEGCDFEPFERAQYDSFNALLAALAQAYPIEAVAGHSDVAPGRKTDPGDFFDWDRIALPPGCRIARNPAAQRGPNRPPRGRALGESGASKKGGKAEGK